MLHTGPQQLRQIMLTVGLAALLGLIWTYWYLTQWFGWRANAHTAIVSAYYAGGLALGLFAAFLGDRWLLRRIGGPAFRRIFWLALALVMVAGFTAALLGLQYRFYYAQWHEPFLSRTWIIQLVSTAVGSIAQYGIFGIRYHGPGALVIILGTCWWATRTRH